MRKNDRNQVQAQTKPTQQRVVIRDPEVSRVGLEVIGTQPLIMNDFAQKTIEDLLRGHMGGHRERAKKVPRECVENAISRNESGVVAMTPIAFKKASISGAAGLTGKSYAKTNLRLTFGVVGASIPISCREMIPRMDVVRTKAGTPDIRFRPQFNDWSARIVFEFTQPLSLDGVVDLVQRGGRVGIGEWRPEKNGVYGTFRIKRSLSAHEVDETIAACSTPMRMPRIPEWALDADIDFTALLEEVAAEMHRENDAAIESPRQKNGKAGAFSADAE